MCDESDSQTTADANSCAACLATLVQNLREDLGDPDLPFVWGNIYTGVLAAKHPYSATVNAALKDLPNQVANTFCASSDGLSDKGDGVHLGAPSQWKFGTRYAAGMISLLQH